MEFALCEMVGTKQRDFVRQRLMAVVMNRMRMGEPAEEKAVASPGEQVEETRGARAADQVRPAEGSSRHRPER